MKKTLLILIAVMVGCSINAQSDYSNYLNKALEKLEAGECESAQRFYNIYKELSGSQSSYVESRIQECSEKGKKYKIGEAMDMNVNYSLTNETTGTKKSFSNKFHGQIAYVDNSGNHGMAVYYYGSGNLTDPFDGILIPLGWLPTYSEFLQFLPNLYKLGFEEGDEFWTRSSNDSQTYKCVKIGRNGQCTTVYRDKEKGSSGILLKGNF